MNPAKRILPLSLACMLSTSASLAQFPDQQTEFAVRVALLEEKLEQVESLRAIKRLQYAYGHYVEFGLWNDFADLFADDAVAHYPAGDLGREAIRELFYEQVGGGQLGLAEGRLYPHFVLQPVVTLGSSGQTAHGRWHVLTMLGGYGGNATWVDGVYENDYVLEDGAWKISELRTYTVFSGGYENGWTNPRAPAADSEICENYLLSDCTIAFHYRPANVGAPLSLATDVIVAAANLEQLSSKLAEIDRRIGRLLDETSVTSLQHSYGYYVDRKQWDAVANLFADDATLELGLQGVYRGGDSIRRALDQFGPKGIAAGELNEHLQLETIVTVAPDGRTANARGIDFALIGWRDNDDYRAEWREAVFENTFVKQNGVWKIAAMHLYPRFATDYTLGWAKDAQPAPAASSEFPPDEPPTVLHGVYPDFYIPPFHFQNPVTGASPQYPAGTIARAMPASLPAQERVAAAARTDVAADAFSDELTTAEQRLERAIGFDAVENLANAYNFYLDEFDRAAADGLFGENVATDVIGIDVAGGRESIVEAIEGPRREGSIGRPDGFMMIHQALQPVIEIAEDGSSARFRLRLFGSSGELGEDGAWIAGIYDGYASAQNGSWQLEQMDLNLTWAADYSAGWASAAPTARITSVPRWSGQ